MLSSTTTKKQGLTPKKLLGLSELHCTLRPSSSCSSDMCIGIQRLCVDVRLLNRQLRLCVCTKLPKGPISPLRMSACLNDDNVGPCRDLLKEKKVAAGARWSKTKDSLASDRRYKALARDVREQIFRKYVAEQEVCNAAIFWWRCLQRTQEMPTLYHLQSLKSSVAM